MITRRLKGGIIKIYKQEANEIESFTMLHINEDEMNRLLKVGNWTMDSDNVLVAKTTYKDDLDLVWKDIASKHQKSSKKFCDVSKVYKSKVPGTSMLYRDPAKHIIKIAYRDPENTTSINKVCIDNDRRDLFFRDCKKATYFKTYGKYGIDLHDEELYNY